MKTLYINHDSLRFRDLKIIDAVQKLVPFSCEGSRVLESVRRYLYKTAPADFWIE